MDIQHLSGTAGSRSDKICKEQFVYARDHVGDIPIDIRLNIGAVEDIPIPVSSAPMAGHTSIPYSLVHFCGRAPCQVVFSLIQFLYAE